MDLYRNLGIIRYHYGYGKDMLFSVIRPFKVPLILTYSFGNTFQSKSMEVYIIFCGNQPPHYIVIFKAKDADNLEQAFREFTAKTLSKEQG